MSQGVYFYFYSLLRQFFVARHQRLTLSSSQVLLVPLLCDIINAHQLLDFQNCIQHVRPNCRATDLECCRILEWGDPC